MGYAVIMFFIMLLMALAISLSANYGMSKDSEEAPLLAQNAYAEREGGKGQTDMIVEATKVNGTMYYTDTDTTNGSETINLYLTVKNNGSININPLKYSIILNGTWVWINSASDNTTYPLEKTNTSSLVLTQKPRNLTLTAENGVKIIIPSAPKITGIDIKPNTTGTTNCYYDLNLSWESSVGKMWPITHYTVYYTFADVTTKNDNVSIALTLGPTNNFFIGEAIRRTSQGQCSEVVGESQVYVWITASDTHGNEGVPSNTCYASGGSVRGEWCDKI